MSETNEILAQDLKILEAMIAQLAAYLASDATYWPMHQDGMPKLTLGGCLMRQERLQLLRRQLILADEGRLDKAVENFEAVIGVQVVRFEGRAHDELHARLREWTSYLRDASKASTKREYYANVVDTRIVITALMNKLSQRPYQLNTRLAQDIAQIDKHLEGKWQSGEFVLDPVWAEAYPVEKYWWLYGCPR
ncbi:MAG: hypothetical protein R6X34_07745 [Chloroflexota bacterium]